MKPFVVVLVLLTLVAGGCAARKERLKLLAECRYLLVKYPGVKSLHSPECFIIKPGTLEKTDSFVASYEFERLIQSIYPPNLTLVVTRKGGSLPTPVLIKSGRAGESVFKPLKHTVDYTGEIHRYQFGRYAMTAIQGLSGRKWDHKLILAVEPQG
ncbi:MAG: hypothetical protein GTO40_28475 [Deltaproteobacteria bacterium]|nr:hypothetical protein [Deltaproteobacteria bacterium]